MTQFTLVKQYAFAAAAVLMLISAEPARSSGTEAEDGFRPIFDGQTLEGWSAPDMRYWSVEDGAITARSSKDVPCSKNQFLVWQRGKLDDFELKLNFRILGPPSANSGIQIRSTIAADGHATGYQADMDRSGTWMGALYDEHTGRRGLAKRGQRTRIDEYGKRAEEALTGGPVKIDLDGWNQYHIVARGSHIMLKINGTTTAEVFDHEKAHRDLSGKLALQIHSGPPMTVQFKDISLKRLPLADGRKKIVMIAGRPSHPSGQHEFNAGVKLLAKRLRDNDSVVLANYHDNGWPADPTAMDNADAIIVYADGLKSHPLLSHLKEVDGLMRKGVGLMCMHFAVHVEAGAEGELFRRWIGGYYETGYSSNPHWDADLKLNAKHPILRGATPGVIHDEWYFSIRFREDATDVTTLMEAKPSDKTRSMNNWPRVSYPHIVAAAGRSETLMWAVERPDGGRGVGFTGGHWHHNWAYDLQRNAILNAMLWVAGAEVPEGGIRSANVDEQELNENLDPKRKMVRVELPAGLKPSD